MQTNLLTELRQSYPNAYKPWLLDEDLKLRELFLIDTSMPQLCKELGRQEGGIIRRIEKLGLLKSNQFNVTVYNPTRLQIVLLRLVSFLDKRKKK